MLAAGICAILSLSKELIAQRSAVSMADFAAGSEYESYLRAMQVAGLVPLYPWSIRAFSRARILKLAESDSTGAWALKSRVQNERISLGPVMAAATVNSAYPYGTNDGPVWAGRGLTLAASAAIAGGAGPFSFTVAPIAFWAGNSAFELLPNGKTGPQAFNTGTFTDNIDLPQRFGSRPYARIDPGGTQLRLDSRFISAGASTANEWIGPATEYPFLLGTNAPGFPHVFLGTGEPVNIGIGRLHARLLWGRLDQSAYSPVTGESQFKFDTASGRVVQGGTVRLAASGVVVFVPRGVPGLELGAARFFHVPNTVDQPNSAFWTKPLKVIFLKNERAQADTGGFDNQLASIFFRWVFPRSGVEVFGERGFEDQLYDLRDLILDIDHEREYMLGFQKILSRSGRRLDVLRGELVNYQEPTLARVRNEAGIYVHFVLNQGHTNRGQLLGASPGAGWAAASTLAWTRYTERGQTSATFRRIVRAQRGEFQTTGIADSRASDVIIAAGLERTRFGRLVDLKAKLEAMQDFNRNFSRDVPNLSLQVAARFHR